MFEGFKYRVAKNLALMQMEQHGAISKDKLRTMSDVAFSPLNSSYGKALIKRGAAKCNHSAAASVFARLAVSAERTTSPQITPENWQTAARYALINAGADERSSYLASAHLVQFHRDEAYI